ncbi:MAG TPA: DUF4412 domain-containing protein [Bacteroidales bacterium]|nr:DUF4412 domain-containing protein [Bacteroidales bacterium]
MKKLILMFVVSLFFLPLSAQFKAKMVFNNLGQARSFKVFSADEGYRYEFNENGQEGVVIVKKDSPEILILMPQQKMAMKGSAGSSMSMGNDPVSAYQYYEKDGTVKEIGSETINGVKCTKSELWNITGDEYGQVTQKMFTVWTSDKYKFPMKIINHIDGSQGSGMELRDIEPWTPDAKSFSIPEGYQVMEMPDMMP